MIPLDELSPSESRYVRWCELMFTLCCITAARCPAEEWPALRDVIMRATPQHQEAVEMMEKTMAEMWWAEGELETLHRILQRLLSLRFNSLPEVVVQRIKRCSDVEKLTTAIERTSQMQSLDELQL